MLDARGDILEIAVVDVYCFFGGMGEIVYEAGDCVEFDAGLFEVFFCDSAEF